jgi:hypothetical protein
MKASQVGTIIVSVIIALTAGVLIGRYYTIPDDTKDGAVIVLKPRKDAGGAPTDYLVWEDSLSGEEYTEGSSTFVDCCVVEPENCELRKDFFNGVTLFELFKETASDDVSELHDAGTAELKYEDEDGKVYIFHIVHENDADGLVWKVSIDGGDFCVIKPIPQGNRKVPLELFNIKRTELKLIKYLSSDESVSIPCDSLRIEIPSTEEP